MLATAPTRAADSCPTRTDEIANDRPDVTNSSLVVPDGSVQAKNGLDWAVRNGSNLLNASSWEPPQNRGWLEGANQSGSAM